MQIYFVYNFPLNKKLTRKVSFCENKYYCIKFQQNIQNTKFEKTGYFFPVKIWDNATTLGQLVQEIYGRK
jgi:hypothetical protein